MKKAKLIIIILCVVFAAATIINLVFSLKRGESNAIMSILSDFFLAGMLITAIIFAYKRNGPTDNKVFLAFAWILPILFIISGVLGITRL